MEGAEHELRPLHKQGYVFFVPEAAQVLKPGGVREVVQSDIGLQAQLLHGIQDVMESVAREGLVSLGHFAWCFRWRQEQDSGKAAGCRHHHRLRLQGW